VAQRLGVNVACSTGVIRWYDVRVWFAGGSFARRLLVAFGAGSP